MQNESGRTMLEMLGVLAIMGIITYGAIAGINYGMSSYKINQAYSEIQDIIQGVEDLYSWSKEYPSSFDMMRAACTNDVFAQPCTGGGSKGHGAFGEISITPNSDQTNFVVSVNLVDEDECARLTAMDWESSNIKCIDPNHPGNNCSCTAVIGEIGEGQAATYVLGFSPSED